MAYRLIGLRLPRLVILFAIVSDFLLSLSQVQMAMIGLLPVSYLCCGFLPFPLLAFQSAASIGYCLVSTGHHCALGRGVPALEQTLAWAGIYSFTYQAVVVLLIGSIDHRRERNGEFIWAFIFFSPGLLTSAIFVFTLALGKVGHLAYVETLTEIRSGQWTILDYAHGQGIVSFPSFHTTVAVLFVYAARRRLLALAIFFRSTLCLLRRLLIGGHYLVDLAAGAVVAVASIAAARFVRYRLLAVDLRVHRDDRRSWPYTNDPSNPTGRAMANCHSVSPPRQY